MFQTLYDDLPPMSTEVLALRKKFWDAEGYHLILNSPKNLADVWKKGPLRPFAGLCVAFLVLIREDHQMFCPQIGTRPKCYQVGYAPQKKNHAFGLISIANTGGTSWVGYKDPDHDGFPAGYYYSCFYFINQNTLHGFINNIHLPSDNANPYEVNKASEDILFGQGGYHEAENLEIHWVVWSSVDNKSSNPSLLDKLFAPDDHGEYDYEAATLFHGTNGCVITIVTKFQQNTHAGKRASASYKWKPWVTFWTGPGIHDFGATSFTSATFINNCLNACYPRYSASLVIKRNFISSLRCRDQSSCVHILCVIFLKY
ncbi:uncharacterized protein [Dermacentor andersoni]|uniref:uncharacterized protein isoform X2 n=1 Tax=Dermacentor andersoni TaxID=34620 RepID=UPI003B3B55F8